MKKTIGINNMINGEIGINIQSWKKIIIVLKIVSLESNCIKFCCRFFLLEIRFCRITKNGVIMSNKKLDISIPKEIKN